MTPAKDWDKIELYYKERDESNLLELVKYIKSSGLSKRLFAITSLNTLVISIYDPIEWGRETLHISFNPTNKWWEFEYSAIPNPHGGLCEFQRIYSEDKGIEKFQNFIKMINW